ncbi:MAG: DNA gyrase/topoisomerase IV subunit A, partial [Bacteroidota bacterium]
SFKADERIAQLEEDLRRVADHLAKLTDYAIDYYQRLLDKYGKERTRKTEITTFDKVKIVQVAANNAKLYVNRKEGFVGSGMKKDEFVANCSDLDDIIVIRKDGKLVVTRIADKTFVGKNILHVDVWKKGDERTTYNVVYLDGKTGRSMAKRFNVKAITRDREYDLTKGAKGSRILYLTANPNGEAESVTVTLSPGSKSRKKVFDFDFSELAIKGRGAGGNIITRYPVRKIVLAEAGKSTLGAMQVWMDPVSGRLFTEEHGKLLGGFDTGDRLLMVYKNGSYELAELDLNRKFEPDQLWHIGKYRDGQVISAVYWEGERGTTLAKRFEIETKADGQNFPFISEHKQSKLYFASVHPAPVVDLGYRQDRQKKVRRIELVDFIDVKGWKSLGNKVTDYKIISVDDVSPKEKAQKGKASSNGKSLKPGDSIEFEF